MNCWHSLCKDRLLRLPILPDEVLGTMFATGAVELPVSKAPAAGLHERMSIDTAVREMTRVCLIQILGNTSAIAAGFGGHEHVHQARVGIRKLRTVLTEFGSWCPAFEPKWRTDLAGVFARLGEARDRDVVLAGWLRMLEQEGSPKITMPQPAGDGSVALVQGVDFTSLMRSLMAYAHGAPYTSVHDPILVGIVCQVMEKLRCRSVKRADGFRQLPVGEQHDVRRQLKRLRYVAELTASLFGRSKVARYVAALTPAQNALGALTDLAVATERFKELTAIDPNAWFAVGWLRARHASTVQACEKPLRHAERVGAYWSR